MWLRLSLSLLEERLNGFLMDNVTSGLGHCFWLPVSAGDTLLGVKHIFQFQKFGCLACIVLRNLKFEFYCGFCESRKLSK